MKTIDIVMVFILVLSSLVLASVEQNNIVYYIAAFLMPLSAIFLVVGVEGRLPDDEPMEKRLEREDSKVLHHLIDDDLTLEDVKNMSDQTAMESELGSEC